MTILETIRNRRSVRDFRGEALTPGQVEALIEAIRWAPSAGNLQSRRFYFIFREKVKKQLAKAALNQNFIAEAPLVVVGCLDRSISLRYGDRGVNLYSIQDVAASVQNMMLLAHSLGLGTCWVGAFNEYDVFEILDLPENLRPVALVPVGYPGRVPKAPRRISGEDAVVILD